MWNSTKVIVLGMLVHVLALKAQVADTLYQDIEGVVVTGQLEPQSIRKSVHNVRVISNADIQNLAANNLGDVLSQYLNIIVTPNGQTGRSSVSLFGLDGQYFKILIDNIPIVSDTGLGNEVDLTQINLDNVERIEIIEGAMGVTHGANAVSGILNIITKKKSNYDIEASASLQEETVGKEYSWFDRGKHIQNIKIAHTFKDKWYISLGANRNDFRGFYNQQKGKEYTINDGKRGVEWLPKEQLTGNVTLGYQEQDTRIFYKFDVFDELVSYYNPVVVPVDNYPFPNTYYANDKQYPTRRYFHHFNYYGKIFSDYTLNISISYQKQQREQERFNYHILENEPRNNIKEVFHANEVWYSVGTINNFIKNKNYDFQLGYELVNENSFANANAGMFRNDNQEAHNVQKRFENYDLFWLSEMHFENGFSLRPGFRYSFQSKFQNQHSYSIAMRYLITETSEVRLSSGKSYRTPNFSELYTYFVDSNHNIQGNDELVPEQGFYTEANYKRNFYSSDKFSSNHALTMGFMKVKDKINLSLVSLYPISQYKYVNIDDYKMWNATLDNKFSYQNLDISLGFALIGISQQIRSDVFGTASDDKFLYSFNVNTSVSYKLPEQNMIFSLYYKHNGRTQQFIADQSSAVGFTISEVQAYNWLDASVKKAFLNKKIDLIFGVRNLLDIKQINTTSQSNIGGGVHGGGNNAIMLGYGRSYFVNFTYNFRL
ncbi:MAG: TonB-dependent receptor [Bacteroidota bacterium]|nr:TonB-dependent receptor [Bacteroidota bacterium]